jgi:hypothetical protein
MTIDAIPINDGPKIQKHFLKDAFLVFYKLCSLVKLTVKN